MPSDSRTQFLADPVLPPFEGFDAVNEALEPVGLIEGKIELGCETVELEGEERGPGMGREGRESVRILSRKLRREHVCAIGPSASRSGVRSAQREGRTLNMIGFDQKDHLPALALPVATLEGLLPPLLSTRNRERQRFVVRDIEQGRKHRARLLRVQRHSLRWRRRGEVQRRRRHRHTQQAKVFDSHFGGEKPVQHGNSFIISLPLSPTHSPTPSESYPIAVAIRFNSSQIVQISNYVESLCTPLKLMSRSSLLSHMRLHDFQHDQSKIDGRRNRLPKICGSLDLRCERCAALMFSPR